MISSTARLIIIVIGTLLAIGGAVTGIYFATKPLSSKCSDGFGLQGKNSVYRINDKPCTQQSARCYYPYTSDKSITSYLCCKNHLIELLSYIVDVFDQNGIVYFLDYGTLLGCIRDESFIPWDTDIDIGVIDSDKLIEVMGIVSRNDKN